MLTRFNKGRKVRLFLRELRDNGGFVGKACETVKVSKPSVYAWRKRHSIFAAAWDRVVELATEDLENEARRRAYHGVEEPVFYQGEVCGHIRKFSDALLMFTLKARKSEYRDKIQIDVKQLDSDIERELAILAAGREADTSGSAESEAVN
jgi:hypothetical protein